ncbi:hypothetical protein ACQ4LH_22285, partial [Pseudomonas peli]
MTSAKDDAAGLQISNRPTSHCLLSTSLQRLSTGKRINSAKDDAAGLQISNRLTS